MRGGFVQATCLLNELANPELKAVMMRIRRKPREYDEKRQDLSRKQVVIGFLRLLHTMWMCSGVHMAGMPVAAVSMR